MRRKSCLRWMGILIGMVILFGAGFISGALLTYHFLSYIDELLTSRVSEAISRPFPQQSRQTMVVQITVIATPRPAASSTPTPIPTATVTPTPSKTPQNIPAGATQVSEIDGMTMVFIPAGEFLMGYEEIEGVSSNTDAMPMHRVYLDDYWIDQTEVTNAMFAKFVEATGYQTEVERSGWGWVFGVGSSNWHILQGASWKKPHGPVEVPGFESHPVVQVSWNDAAAYCRWAGRRLPTEAEWEKAARGTDGRIFPWGNEMAFKNRLNFADKRLAIGGADLTIDDRYPLTAPVGRFPNGASAYGLLDMAGNVWEWTADWYDPGYYLASPYANPSGPESGDRRVARGGSWYDAANLAMVTVRLPARPQDAHAYLGFRCAR